MSLRDAPIERQPADIDGGSNGASLVRHGRRLLNVASMEFAMPVPIMRDHFAFKVSKQRSWTDNGRRLTEFKMQPSSMVIRWMADAFYYVFDDESRSLIEYRGVTIAKTADNGKLKDMKARIAYSPTAPMNATGK